MRAPRLTSEVWGHAAICAESSSNQTESPAAGSHSAVLKGATGPAPASGHGRRSAIVSTALVQVTVLACQSCWIAPRLSSTGSSLVLASVSRNATKRPPRNVSDVSVSVVPAVSLTDADAGYAPNRNRVRASRVPAKDLASTPMPKSAGVPKPPMTWSPEAKSSQGMCSSNVIGSSGNSASSSDVGVCSSHATTPSTVKPSNDPVRFLRTLSRSNSVICRAVPASPRRARAEVRPMSTVFEDHPPPKRRRDPARTERGPDSMHRRGRRAARHR